MYRIFKFISKEIQGSIQVFFIDEYGYMLKMFIDTVIFIFSNIFLVDVLIRCQYSNLKFSRLFEYVFRLWKKLPVDYFTVCPKSSFETMKQVF